MSALTQLPKFIQFPTTTDDVLDAQRLFHGRGHAYKELHHVTIDWLPPVILITLFAPEPCTAIEQLADFILLQLPACQSIQLQHRYQLSGPVDIIRGQHAQHFSIREDNLHFHIRLGKTRNIGLFLDMRNGRKWVQQNSQGKRILNLFSYTCGFSVAALAGNASTVMNVDMSSAALSVGRDNHRLNHQPLDNVKFEKLNILKSFARLKKRGPFDLLICDPPTFQKGSIDILRDYPKIMHHFDDFMAAKSQLLLCLNAPELNQEFLIDHMSDLAPQFNFIEEIKAPTVYKEIQNKGLKVLYFKSR